ncbi:adhesion protein [Treponema primitia ZAS-2]|uniref:Adhesion protein n=1 Tax=Treponema primitia (strain ATCC BAA-887 / DSM 12427 / ZAS-2) TaxID=545694 RepID=F5YLP8_TREPZ|nr:zinc ABC transporter substrate-binding protein [Treponema primitia]AEF85751.1 adhesion protein [Treponema primitia ZAS-2]
MNLPLLAVRGRTTIVTRFSLFCFLIILTLNGCGENTTKGAQKKAPAPDTPVLAVSTIPQEWFARRVSGTCNEVSSTDRLRILTLVGPGQNPHSYEPGPKQMADLAAARAWVLSGTEFELSLKPKIEALFPNLRIINGTAGVRFRTLEAHDDGDVDHVDEGSLDRHTWLGQEPAKIMAGHILEACIAIDGDGTAYYQKNYEELIADIDQEFAELGIKLAPLRGRTVFVYHPAFGYFLDEFGITQEAVETGGKEPTPRVLNALIEKARREGAAAIFVQAQFPVASARTVAAAAGAVIAALDPLAPDWLANIRDMGDLLLKSLEEAKK